MNLVSKSGLLFNMAMAQNDQYRSVKCNKLSVK